MNGNYKRIYCIKYLLANVCFYVPIVVPLTFFLNCQNQRHTGALSLHCHFYRKLLIIVFRSFDWVLSSTWHHLFADH